MSEIEWYHIGHFYTQKKTEKDTSISYVWLSVQLSGAEYHHRIMCRVLLPEGMCRSLVTWKLLIVWTMSLPAMMGGLCSLAACYRPGGTMPSIESFREREHGSDYWDVKHLEVQWKICGVQWGVDTATLPDRRITESSVRFLPVWHMTDVCHFEGNPTVSQATFTTSVFWCSHRFGCVKFFAALFPVLSASAWVAVKENRMNGLFVTTPEHILSQDQLKIKHSSCPWSTFQINYDAFVFLPITFFQLWFHWLQSFDLAYLHKLHMRDQRRRCIHSYVIPIYFVGLCLYPEAEHFLLDIRRVDNCFGQWDR